jgi:hypothetical protein
MQHSLELQVLQPMGLYATIVILVQQEQQLLPSTKAALLHTKLATGLIYATFGEMPIAEATW